MNFCAWTLCLYSTSPKLPLPSMRSILSIRPAIRNTTLIIHMFSTRAPEKCALPMIPYVPPGFLHKVHYKHMIRTTLQRRHEKLRSRMDPRLHVPMPLSLGNIDETTTSREHGPMMTTTAVFRFNNQKMTPIVYNKRIQFTTLEPHITQNVMFPSVGHEYGHTPSYGIPNKVSLGIKQAGINVNKHETHNKQPATRFIIPSNPYTFSSKISSSYILTLLALSIKAPICIDALHTAFGTRNLHDLTNSCSIDHAADMHVSLVEKLWKAGRLPVDLEQKKEDMDLDPDRGSLARAVSLGKEMKSYGGGPVGGRINVDGYVTGWARRRWEKEGSNQERKNREQIEMEKEKTEWKKLESKEADRKDKEQKEAPRKKAYRKEVERKVRERKETEQKELKGKKLGRKDIGEQDAESTEIEWQYHETQEMIRNEIDIKNEAMGYTEDRYSRRMELTRKAKIRRELDRRQLEWSIKFKDK